MGAVQLRHPPERLRCLGRARLVRFAVVGVALRFRTVIWRSSSVAPAVRSRQAVIKDAGKETPDGLPLYRYRDLLEHLATLNRQTIDFNGQKIEKITMPTQVQARAFDLLGSSVPTRLT